MTKKTFNIVNSILIFLSVILFFVNSSYFQTIISLTYITIPITLMLNYNADLIDKNILKYFSMSLLIYGLVDIMRLLLFSSSSNKGMDNPVYIIGLIVTQAFMLLSITNWSKYTFREWEYKRVRVEIYKTMTLVLPLAFLEYSKTVTGNLNPSISTFSLLGVSYLFLHIFILLAICSIMFTKNIKDSARIKISFMVIYLAFFFKNTSIYYANVVMPNYMIVLHNALSLCIIISAYLVNYFLNNSKSYADKYNDSKYATYDNFSKRVVKFLTIGYILFSYIFEIITINQVVFCIFIYSMVELIDKYSKESSSKELELKRKLTVDNLTGLRNREFFIKEVNKQIIKYPKETFVIVYINIDRFKVINDLYGHYVGDQVIKEIARRLDGVKTDDSLLARLNGDNFGMLVHYNDIDEINYKTIPNIKGVSSPISIDEYNIYLNISAGISKYPCDTTDVNCLLNYANNAMNEAKKDGEARFEYHNLEYQKNLEVRNKIEVMLREANFDKEFELYFQPQIDSRTSKIVSAETLLRWKTKEGKYVSPAIFIPIAEETGMIYDISRWVAKECSKQTVYWAKKFNNNFKLSFNVSSLDMHSIEFAKYFLELLDKYNVPKDMLKVEITERTAIQLDEKPHKSIKMLNDRGIGFSIDDFGVDYACLNFVSDYNINEIKIPRELINNIAVDKKQYHLVKLISNMAKDFNILSVCEGIETRDQFEIIKELGIDVIQGYYFDKPLTSLALETKYFM